ncbi:MAG: helicase RepA family protein [Deltaproteobacteria bacterium]|nr:helicase RepA family protein [Deltaproteobacteria bacterium]
MLVKHKFEVVVFDPLIKFHELDENSNMGMSNLMSQMDWISSVTGAAVILVQRVGKAAAGNRECSGDVQHAARGAPSITDDVNVRFAGNILRYPPKSSRAACSNSPRALFLTDP